MKFESEKKEKVRGKVKIRASTQRKRFKITKSDASRLAIKAIHRQPARAMATAQRRL